MSNTIYTVTQINNYSSQILKKKLSNIWVKGEISSLKIYPSGFAYITLRDSNSELSCICSSKLVNNIKEGVSVTVNGDISIYAIKGNYQLRVTSLFLDGKGRLWQEYIELKEKLDKEGIFLPTHKREIPAMPKTIGILSSLEGAVIHDICNILERRFPIVNIVLKDTKVNGLNSVEDLCYNFDQLKSFEKLDVIIIARGGGSFEDLSCFNSEKLVRKIFNCNIPVISAIGHETDFTLCDFVSDLRASTPSEAAELVTADIIDLKQSLVEKNDKISFLFTNYIDKKILLLNNYSKIIKPANFNHILIRKCDEVDYKIKELINILKSKFYNLSFKLQSVDAIIKNNNIKKIKDMGFSIIRKNNQIVKDYNDLDLNDIIQIDMAVGNVNVKVKDLYDD